MRLNKREPDPDRGRVPQSKEEVKGNNFRDHYLTVEVHYVIKWEICIIFFLQSKKNAIFA